MKRYVILLLTLICIHTAYAQRDLFQTEFVKYPDIEQFRVELWGDTVYTVVVKFKQDRRSTLGKKPRDETYTFMFDGDRYLFTRKYNEGILKLSPKDIDSSKILRKPEREKGRLLCVIVYPDSIAYEYGFSVNWQAIHAGYKGWREKFALLGNELQHYAHDIAREKDSILFFQAIIGLGGSIEAMELTQGKGEQYTDEIIRFFKSQKNAWNPLSKEGRRFRSLVDISVKLGRNGKVSTSHSHNLRIPKIEIKDYANMWHWYHPPKE